MPLNVLLSEKSISRVSFWSVNVGSGETCAIHLVSFDSPAVQLNVIPSAPAGLEALRFQSVDSSTGDRPVGLDGSHCTPVLHSRFNSGLLDSSDV